MSRKNALSSRNGMCMGLMTLSLHDQSGMGRKSYSLGFFEKELLLK